MMKSANVSNMEPFRDVSDDLVAAASATGCEAPIESRTCEGPSERWGNRLSYGEKLYFRIDYAASGRSWPAWRKDVD